MIDGLSIAIPIRRRTIHTTACLRMMVAHAKLDNEILLCLDRPVDDVREWAVKHEKWFSEHNIHVLTSPFTTVDTRDQFGTAHASNWAWKHASREWLMGMDDDMFVAQNWDYNLARRIRDTSMVYVPVNVVPEIAVDRIAKWDEWYHLTYPRKFQYGDKYNYTVKESEWIQWADEIKVNDVYREGCGVRILAHWYPIVVHKSTFLKSGGFDPGVGRDINYDTKLGKMGYMKVCVRDSLVLHAKGNQKGVMLMNVSAPNIPLGCDNIGL